MKKPAAIIPDERNHHSRLIKVKATLSRLAH
jgi:hypothetical protein